jgi:pimeloyl-ACP methyl ester carboxylesterase
VKLYYEETGTGTPIIFAHEFAGDYRSFEPQVRYFSRSYRCITYSARGYLPSEVPASLDQYGQAVSADDIAAILDHLRIDKAHIVGMAMGAFAVLHFLLRYPKRAMSAVIGGCGTGWDLQTLREFREKAEANARHFAKGMPEAVKDLAANGYRPQLKSKNPRAWAELIAQFAEHSSAGAANIQRGLMKTRPSVAELVEEMGRITVPTLIAVGDDDQPCLEPSLMMRRAIPSSVLWVVPDSGHTLNMEEPETFNRELHLFIAAVESKAWRKHSSRPQA